MLDDMSRGQHAQCSVLANNPGIRLEFLGLGPSNFKEMGAKWWWQIVAVLLTSAVSAEHEGRPQLKVLVSIALV